MLDVNDKKECVYFSTNRRQKIIDDLWLIQATSYLCQNEEPKKSDIFKTSKMSFYRVSRFFVLFF